jgi:hypothetical protein
LSWQPLEPRATVSEAHRSTINQYVAPPNSATTHYA